MMTFPPCVLMRPSCLNSCKVRFTCTVESPERVAELGLGERHPEGMAVHEADGAELRVQLAEQMRDAGVGLRRPMPAIHSRKIAASISVSRQNTSPMRGWAQMKARTVSCGMNATLLATTVPRLWSMFRDAMTASYGKPAVNASTAT